MPLTGMRTPIIDYPYALQEMQVGGLRLQSFCGENEAHFIVGQEAAFKFIGRRSGKLRTTKPGTGVVRHTAGQ